MKRTYETSSMPGAKTFEYLHICKFILFCLSRPFTDVLSFGFSVFVTRSFIKQAVLLAYLNATRFFLITTRINRACRTVHLFRPNIKILDLCFYVHPQTEDSVYGSSNDLLFVICNKNVTSIKC